MSFKDFVIFQLNKQSNFGLNIAGYFNENKLNLDKAVNLIIDNILKALHCKCFGFHKEQEIYKLAKGCSSINIVSPDINGYDAVLSKGKGITSELFGVYLLDVVDSIASGSHVKNKTINSLFAFIAPVAMATLNQINLQNNYSPAEMGAYLLTQANCNPGFLDDLPSKSMGIRKIMQSFLGKFI